MRRNAVLLLVAAGVVVGLAAAPVIPLTRAARAQSGPRIGQAAPDITGGPWINSPPLSMETLRGRVVFVEFWTYG